MKKQLVFGMVMTSVLVSVQAMAAPGRAVEARAKEQEKRVEGQLRTSSKSGQEITSTKKSLLDAYSKVVKKNSESGEKLLAALERGVIKVEVQGKRIEADTVVIAEAILKAEKELNDFNINSIADKAQGEARKAVLEKGIAAAVEFLALAAKTSEMTGVKISEAKANDVAAFTKQLSLIPEIFKMEAGDAQSHIDFMNAVVEKSGKLGPRSNADQAQKEVQKEGKSEEQFAKKQKDLIDC